MLLPLPSHCFNPSKLSCPCRSIFILRGSPLYSVLRKIPRPNFQTAANPKSPPRGPQFHHLVSGGGDAGGCVWPYSSSPCVCVARGKEGGLLLSKRWGAGGKLEQSLGCSGVVADTARLLPGKGQGGPLHGDPNGLATTLPSGKGEHGAEGSIPLPARGFGGEILG